MGTSRSGSGGELETDYEPMKLTSFLTASEIGGLIFETYPQISNNVDRGKIADIRVLHMKVVCVMCLNEAGMANMQFKAGTSQIISGIAIPARLL